MLDLSIIIVSYNTKDLLQECLQSIEDANIKLSYEVIVVDNDSSDDSVATIQHFNNTTHNRKVHVKIIQNEKNVGFSKANNIGIKQSKGKYVLFLNSDTKMEKNTLETMVAFMDKHTEVGASTCFVQLPNGQLDDAAHRGFPTPWNAFCHFSALSQLFPRVKVFSGYNLTWMDLSKTHEIDACAGAFMLVRREAGEQIGWWDEDYFFYGEDLDFCYMLKQNKWKIYFVPVVKILHYKGVSGGMKKISKHLTTADKSTKARATKARFDAMKIFYRKHYQKKYPSWVTKMVFGGIALKQQLTNI